QGAGGQGPVRPEPHPLLPDPQPADRQQGRARPRPDADQAAAAPARPPPAQPLRPPARDRAVARRHPQVTPTPGDLKAPGVAVPPTEHAGWWDPRPPDTPGGGAPAHRTRRVVPFPPTGHAGWW